MYLNYAQVMIVEPDNGGVDLRLLRSADEADDMMMESSGSNYYDTGSSNDRKLKDIHIVIIAVGIFLISCFSLTCLVSSYSNHALQALYHLLSHIPHR